MYYLTKNYLLLKTKVQSMNVRYKRSFFTSLTGGLVKVISFAVNLTIVRLAFNYLGPVKYGLWMTITSFVFLVGFADLGIGNGLTNSVSACFGQKNTYKIRTNISSAFFILVFISGTLIFLLIVTMMFTDFGWLLNKNQQDLHAETKLSIFFMMSIFSFNIFFGTAQRIQVGLQQGYKTNIFQGLGFVVSLVLTSLTIKMNGNLPAIVAAFSSGPLIASIANNVYFYFFDRPDLVPKFKYFDQVSAKHILHAGFYFFLLQLVVALAFTSDNVIIAKKFNLSEVSDYSIAQRIFMIGPMLQTLIVAPLWPAYGEAKAMKDYRWISKTFWRSLWFSMGICFLASGSILLTSGMITKIWLGTEIKLTTAMLLGFFCWSLLSAYLSAVSTMMNGLHILKSQTIWMSLFGVSSVLIKIYFPDNWGSASVIWITVFCFSIFYGVPSLRLLLSIKEGGLEKLR